MKNLTFLSILFSTAFFLNSCSSSKANPSQNNALNTITSSHKAKSGAMQDSLDDWLKREWTPTIEKNQKIKEKNLNKSRDFTLQEYVDKSVIYIQDTNKSYENSHSKRINSMPVIGK